MLRKIVTIDELKCNGCGLCIGACQEGALQLINGKAKLISDVYCDGLGACLPDCPTGAIAIIEREAAGFDEGKVKQHLAGHHLQERMPQPASGCPGSRAMTIQRRAAEERRSEEKSYPSELRQWPCQLKLVPPNAPYFENADLLVAADCTAYAYASLHSDFMRNKITLIGCPKLDDVNYAVKLTEILRLNALKSLTVLRMEVPCCGGIANAAKEALANSGAVIPWRVVTIGTDGAIREDKSSEFCRYTN